MDLDHCVAQTLLGCRHLAKRGTTRGLLGRYQLPRQRSTRPDMPLRSSSASRLFLEWPLIRGWHLVGTHRAARAGPTAKNLPIYRPKSPRRGKKGRLGMDERAPNWVQGLAAEGGLGSARRREQGHHPRKPNPRSPFAHYPVQYHEKPITPVVSLKLIFIQQFMTDLRVDDLSGVRNPLLRQHGYNVPEGSIHAASLNSPGCWCSGYRGGHLCASSTSAGENWLVQGQ